MTLVENRHIRVFISSTFQDMQGERDYLVKRTFPKLRMLAAERDVVITELDLRWGITPEESQSGKVVEICLREIENSIPFFVGIIGNRYGWVPSRGDLESSITERYKEVDRYLEKSLSVTEMEMQFGVLERPEDMHAFFYINEFEDKYVENFDKLNQLKQAVRTNGRYPVLTYTDPEDLSKKVEKAFRGLLDQLFPEKDYSPMQKELLAQKACMDQLCQNYILVDRSFAALNRWLFNGDQHTMVVSGASGMGKSSLVANWTKTLLDASEKQYEVIYRFVGKEGGEESFSHVVETIALEIESRFGIRCNESNEDNKLGRLLSAVSRKGVKCLLVIDGINQIADTRKAKLLSWLPDAPKNTRILISTTEDDSTLSVLSRRNYPVHKLEALETIQRRNLVKSYLGLFGKALSEDQTDRIINAPQCKNTLVLKALLDELRRFGRFANLDSRIDYFSEPTTPSGFYQRFLGSFEEEFGDIVKDVCGLLVVAKEGLDEQEIQDILGIRQLTWSEFSLSFGKHLALRGGLVCVSHAFIRDAICERYLKDQERASSFRRRLVEYFANRNDKRAIIELSYQYNLLCDWDKLTKLLDSFKNLRILISDNKYELGIVLQRLFAAGVSSLGCFSSVEEESELEKAERLHEIARLLKDLGYSNEARIIANHAATQIEKIEGTSSKALQYRLEAAEYYLTFLRAGTKDMLEKIRPALDSCTDSSILCYFNWVSALYWLAVHQNSKARESVRRFKRLSKASKNSTDFIEDYCKAEGLIVISFSNVDYPKTKWKRILMFPRMLVGYFLSGLGFKRLKPIFVEVYGSNSLEVADLYNKLGWTQHKSVELYKEALKIYRYYYGNSGSKVYYTNLTLGRLLARSNYGEARNYLEAAIEAAVNSEILDPYDMQVERICKDTQMIAKQYGDNELDEYCELMIAERGSLEELKARYKQYLELGKARALQRVKIAIVKFYNNHKWDPSGIDWNDIDKSRPWDEIQYELEELDDFE